MAIRQEQEHREQHYLMGELESLGLSSIRINEFNDNTELRGLVKALKEAFLRKYLNLTRRPV
jgi:hypothetical protein